MSGLNPAQQEAVDTLSGPLLVLAGAGTGKTRVVTMRIGKLIKNGIRPERILAVTFTNKAASEMKERVAEQIGKKSKKKPVVSTFHSLCVKILREHIDKLGYPKSFVIYSRGDQESIIRTVLREIRVNEKNMKPGDVLNKIGSWKSRSVRPDEAGRLAESDKEHIASLAYRRYQRELKNRGAVDFDDLLLLTEQLFAEHKDALAVEVAKYDHLLIDEYQDTNQSQYRIATALVAGHRNLCVVGDDDQSIYAWRGAEVEHILRFSRDWKDAKVVRLESNYRSTQPILDWANRLIDFNVVRHGKVLTAARERGPAPAIFQYKDENLEAQETVVQIRQRLSEKGVEPQDIAILFRTNEQPRVFETELRKAKIPYVLIGTQSFFDRKEVKDLVCYLRVIALPQDEVSLLRIINTPKRGIGQSVVEGLLEVATKGGVTVWDLICGKVPGPTLRPAAVNAVKAFRDQIVDLQQQSQSMTAVAITEKLIQAIEYRSFIESQYDEPEEQEARWANVAAVVNAAADFDRDHPEGGKLAEFLGELTLGDREMENDKEKQLRRNAIILMTLHSAKGLEFPEVYMVGMEEGILPHVRSLDAEENIAEERRLCYVGITRAQMRLTLSFPLTRKRWGKERDTIPSRFLYEMTGKAENPKHVSGR